MPILTELFIYPLKSGANLPRAQARAEPRGLEHDRRWMVVRPDGTFITGRQVPSLVRIRAVPEDGGLLLSAPGRPELRVSAPAPDAPRMDVTVWGDRCSAARAGEAADAWLGAFFGEPVSLVHVDARMERQVDLTYASPGEQVGFADGFPMLLLSRGSLEEVNRRVARPVTMLHFRPNLVVDDCAPFAEDGWKRLRIGEVELAVVKPCARCVFTTVDPSTGEKSRDGEPLRTLTAFRREGNKVLFGQNVLVRRPGTLRVGDRVEVLG